MPPTDGSGHAEDLNAEFGPEHFCLAHTDPEGLLSQPKPIMNRMSWIKSNNRTFVNIFWNLNHEVTGKSAQLCQKTPQYGNITKAFISFCVVCFATCNRASLFWDSWSIWVSCQLLLGAVGERPVCPERQMLRVEGKKRKWEDQIKPPDHSRGLSWSKN